MHSDFWLQRWSRNEIGFHQREPNSYLECFWPTLGLPVATTVFVPLCGKSLDMRWLREHAQHRVLGVELAPEACRDFFREWHLEPTVTRAAHFERYEANRVTLLCGDFFDLAPADLSECTAVFDRAALIALPADMRRKYANHLRSILPSDARLLLITAQYAQSEMSGPPFSVDDAEVRERFAGARINELATFDVTDAPENARFKQRGVSSLIERVYDIELVR